MRTSLAALALAAALVAAACTSGTGSEAAPSSTTRLATTTTTTDGHPADAVPIDRWATGFCSAFGAWSVKVAQAGAGVAGSVDPGDVPGAKAAIEDLFARAERDTDALLAELRRGGVPDVVDGDALVDDLADRFTDYRQAIADAGKTAAALPTDDADAFQRQVAALVSGVEAQLTEVGRSFERIDAKYPSPELRAALEARCSS
ncbi:hypothetical protein KSP35_04280 [Aquihabitans sp. G128]|uniref:hypothetical protein n=1 Tax=Aquihabitans sp. G128 TaxID=2849779 RepID=UPI001C2350EE|nr:hypothetical protein [Aquihabitans sp. G128]QXC62038.1 hypothetical protein KSP35_04280 [Aquihabitans sp. G128]